MRPFEILIFFIVISAIIILPRFSSRKAKTIYFFSFIIAFLCHLISEGIRWQMSLIYIIAVLILFMPSRIFVNYTNKIIFFTVLFLAILPPVLVPVFKLPKPSGQYGIGYDTWNSMDDLSRNDFFTGEFGRSIVAQFYYPIDKGRPKTDNLFPLNLLEGLTGERYVQHETSLAPLAKLLHLPSFFFEHFSLIKINAEEYQPIARNVGSLPILIFTPGRGGFRNHNLIMVQELVSQGYIVVCVDHPGTVAGVAVFNGVLDDGGALVNVPIDKRMMGKINPPWDDKVTQFLASDISFLIDEIIKRTGQTEYDTFFKHIDTNKIGMFGVSLGGMTTAQSCSIDKRIKACLMMDSYIPSNAIKNGISQPVMILTRPASDMNSEKWPKDIVDLHQNTMLEIFNHAPKDAYFMNINGAYHVNFSDAYLYIYEPLGRALGFFGKVDGAKTQKLISQYSLAFFDKYLKGKNGNALLHSQKGDNFDLIAK